MAEKIDQHVFRLVEKELYNYKINKKLIDSWKEESASIGTARSTLSTDGIGRFTTNKITNSTLASVIRLLALEERVLRADWYCRAIEDVLSMLNAENKRLVELRYFMGFLTNEGIARELNISIRDFYRRRTIVIEKIAIRLGLM